MGEMIKDRVLEFKESALALFSGIWGGNLLGASASFVIGCGISRGE